MKKWMIILMIGIIIIVGSVVFLRNREIRNVSNIQGSLIDKISDRILIDEIRGTDSITQNGNYIKNYTSIDRSVVITDDKDIILINIKLNSPYVVSNLIASDDIKVAEFTLVDWKEDKETLFSKVDYFNIKDNYSKINRVFRYKYGTDNEVCNFGDCYTETTWTSFTFLNELPRKNIKIGAFTQTYPLESVEWIPSIEGFEILEWASWNISAVTKIGEIGTAPQVTPNTVFFKSDGTKMYIGGNSPQGVMEFNLSLAWNVSTAVFSSSIGGLAGMADTQDMWFKPDGTKFWTVDNANKIVDSYSMSSAWLVNTSTADGVTFTMSGLLDGIGLAFNNDGTKMYGGDTSSQMIEYNLSSAWDVSSAVQSTSITLTPYDINGIYFKSDGLRMYKGSAGSQIITEYFLDIPWLINTSHFVADLGTLGYTARAPRFDTSGERLYWVDATNDKILQFQGNDTFPTVTLNSPVNNTQSVNGTWVFNCSAKNDNIIQNISLYIDGVFNYTVTDGVTNDTNLTKTLNLGVGNPRIYTWNCLAYDNSGYYDWGITRTLTLNYTLENSQTYNTPVIEKSSQTFAINITYDTNIFTNVQAILKYNNTDYSGIKYIVGSEVIFNKTILVPSVATKTNFTFYWELIFTSGTDTKLNSTFKNQTVNSITIDDCSSNAVELYNFTIVDEKTQKKLTGSTINTSAEIDIDMYTADRGSLITEYYQNFTKTNPFKICLNSSLAGGEEYNLDVQVKYTAQGYVDEYYYIQSERITSSSLAQNITLYDLDNITSTTFAITYKDENFIPLSNAIIQIQRKYVSEGVFKTVEIPKTDSNGQTIAHLEEENVIYTFIVVKDGVLKATFTNFLVKCEDPVLGTCEININAFKSHLEPETFTNTEDFLFTLTYNRTTRTVQSIYTIPSGSVAIVSLNTTLADGLGTTVVCSHSLTSASGTLSCVVPTSFGNSTIINTIYKDGEEVARGMVGIQESPSDLYGANLMFLGFFLMLTLVGVGLGSSPMISGIFLIIGAVLSIAFNLVVNTGFFGATATILWLIIAVVIILMKGAKRE